MQVIGMERYSSQTGSIVHRLTVKPNYNAACIILVNHHATNFEGKKKRKTQKCNYTPMLVHTEKYFTLTTGMERRS